MAGEHKHTHILDRPSSTPASSQDGHERLATAAEAGDAVARHDVKYEQPQQLSGAPARAGSMSSEQAGLAGEERALGAAGAQHQPSQSVALHAVERATRRAGQALPLANESTAGEFT